MRRFNIICRRCGYKGQIDGLLHAVCPGCGTPVVPVTFDIDHDEKRMIPVRYSSNGERTKKHER